MISSHVINIRNVEKHKAKYQIRIRKENAYLLQLS